jgi:phosphatidylinositol-binding clathrin assembly protein
MFQVLNQAMINILGHFFEMSKTDAERAMEIYRTFTRQTDYVVQYLGVARQYEHHTRVEVPKLKHAPVNLGRQLEDYLKDADFEIHRRQYLAELDAKKSGGASSKGGKSETAATNNPFPDVSTNGLSVAASSSKPDPATKGPDPDLIDFFDSIEQNQTPMAMNMQQQQQQQQAQPQLQQPVATQWASNSPFNIPQQTGQQLQGNGFIPPQTGFANNSPFQQQNMGAYNTQQQAPQIMQPNFTGAGFGGYTPQQSFAPSTLSSIPQDSVASFQATTISPPLQTGGLQPGQQTTNPFRQSMLMTGQMSSFPNAGTTATASPLQRQSTNPFARSSPNNAAPSFANSTGSPFQSQPPQQVPAPLQPMATGTNPFAKNFGGSVVQQRPRPQTSGGLMPQPTGTNPFRQGALVNHQTGLGWQHNQGRIGGGFDDIQSTAVFPRPSTGTAWQS